MPLYHGYKSIALHTNFKSFSLVILSDVQYIVISIRSNKKEEGHLLLHIKR